MSYRRVTSIAAVLLVLASALAASALTASALPAGAAPAQQEGGAKSITVVGNGIAFGAPDIAYLNLGVETRNEAISAALEDAAARMDAVLAALTEAGVAPEDIRTASYNIYQESLYPPGPLAEGPDAPSGAQALYHVATTVQITVRDTSQVGELLTVSIDAGANVVNNVQYDIDDRAALEADARAAAVEDARDRAAQLANLLGVTLGEVLQVNEGAPSFPGPFGAGGGYRVAMDTASAPPVSEGTLSVSVSLTVTFAIQ